MSEGLLVGPDPEGRRQRRRDFLALAVVAAALFKSRNAMAQNGRCEADDDPDRAAMRNTLEYVSPSKTPGKACSACDFFTAPAPPCGRCHLLDGPVSPDAVCGSWAPKK